MIWTLKKNTMETQKEEKKEKGDIWIASFDIGIKNFAFWVEKYSIENVEHIRASKAGAGKLTYAPDGTASEETQALLEIVYTSGTCVTFENNALTEEKNAKVERIALCALTELLDSHSQVFDMCDYFVVEKQMNFGKFRNPKAIHLSHHVMSYFFIRYGRLANVIEFPAYHKTQVLGAKKNKILKKGKKGGFKYKAVDKPTRKKWAVERAQDILLARFMSATDGSGIWSQLMHLTESKKKDDVCDCLLQAIAFFVLHIVISPESLAES
jgi:hypothetical protein